MSATPAYDWSSIPGVALIGLMLVPLARDSRP